MNGTAVLEAERIVRHSESPRAAGPSVLVSRLHVIWRVSPTEGQICSIVGTISARAVPAAG
jgi:hypothetical protein